MTIRPYKYFLLAALCLFAGEAAAQPVVRKAYPAPKMTPQVAYIQSLRTHFKPLAEGTVTLPVSVDNSKSMYFPPILDQTGGSCAQASGIGYMFTYEINRYLGRDAKASADNRFAYQFSWNMINGGQDEGGFVDEGLYLAMRYGMMTETDYGWASLYSFKWATGYDKYLRAMHYRASQIVTMPDSIPLIKRYLYDAGDGSQTGGILTFSTQARGWTFNDDYDGPSATGYHSLITSLATSGAHALTIAGYDDLVRYTDAKGVTHTGAFIVVNSWGTYSHDNGRFYLPYDFLRSVNNRPTILSDELVGVKVTTFEPKVVYKVSVTYSSRNDLAFGMNASTDAKRTYMPDYSYCYAFRNQGGDYSMQGAFNTNGIEIAMDYTDRANKLDNIKRYFLNVYCTRQGSRLGAGTVDSVQVIDYRGMTPKVNRAQGDFPKTISMGDNVIIIPTLLYTLSVSPYRWLDVNDILSSNTYLVRTTKGRQAKVKFTGYNPQTGEVSLDYAIFNN